MKVFAIKLITLQSQSQRRVKPFYQSHFRTITINTKLNNDPYYILGVDRDAKFIEVKKQYFLLAKKYHPDLNPNNEYANKMFILIGEAYRHIETEHNPLLREARKKAAEQYEAGPSQGPGSKNFKSKRPENNQGSAFYDGEEGGHQENVNDWHQEKFLRRYRYSHLKSQSQVPMSIRNLDRHGIQNLQHDPVKPLDRLKVPPILIYLTVFGGIFYILAMFQDNEELSFQQLSRKNLFLAIKQNQDQIEYEQDEITAAEELTMKSTQYIEVVEKRQKKDKDKLDAIKSLVLMEGRGTNKMKKVDLTNQ